MAEANVYDSVFKTILNKMPGLLVPLINEAFGRDYPRSERVVLMGGEFEGVAGRRVADSLVMVGGVLYHLECQSTRDPTMAIRMLEYDLAAALAQVRALPREQVPVVRLPASCVVYPTRAAAPAGPLSARIVMPSGEESLYESKVICAQDYGGDEVARKGLLALVPFMPACLAPARGRDPDPGRVERECCRIRGVLTACAGRGPDGAAEAAEVAALAARVCDHVLDGHGELQAKARAIMGGGEVYELVSERIRRETREEDELRFARERERLESQVREQQAERTATAIAGRLRELGVDERVIAEAVGAGA